MTFPTDWPSQDAPGILYGRNGEPKYIDVDRAGEFLALISRFYFARGAFIAQSGTDGKIPAKAVLMQIHQIREIPFGIRSPYEVSMWGIDDVSLSDLEEKCNKVLAKEEK